MNYTIETAKNGSPTASVIIDGKKRYIHSRFVPEKEADIIEQSGQDVTGKVVLIFGFCLGYHLAGKKELFQQSKRLYIIDPLCAAKQTGEVDGLDWLHSDNVRLLCGEAAASVAEEITQYLLSTASSLTVLRHQPSVKIFQQYFSELETELNGKLSVLVAAKKTIDYFAAAFFRNGCKRLRKFAELMDFSKLKGLFGGMDAIVVSSGPSLDAYIDEIGAVRGNYVLIAVDSALPVLQSKNIDADIVISVDPQVWVSEHIQGSSGFIIESFSAHVCQRGDTGRFLLFNTHPLSQICAHFFSTEPHPTTANVAGDALYCALFLGFTSIYLCGMDYSFPHYTIYAKNSAYYRRFSFCCDRISTITTKEMQYIRKGKLVSEEGLRTRHSFLDYKLKTEALIADHADGQEIVHLVKDGLCLKGANFAKSLLTGKDSLKQLKYSDNDAAKIKDCVTAILSGIPPLCADKKSFALLKEWLLRDDVREALFEQSRVKRDKFEVLFDNFLKSM